MLLTAYYKWLQPARWAALFLLLVIFFIAPLATHAQEPSGGLANTAGLEDEAITSNLNIATETPLMLFIARLINVVLGFLGILLVALIMYGGWLYMTSGGNPETIARAKKIWRNAAIGLVIILSSFAIANFVLRAFFGVGRGGDGATTTPGIDPGIGSLGSGLIQSHYPERNQRDVARNASVIITFKEAIDPATVCNDANGDGACVNEDLLKESLSIFTVEAGASMYATDDTDAQAAGVDARVSSSADGRTFFITPINYLGNSSSNQWYAARVFGGNMQKANGDDVQLDAIGGDNRYQWLFEVSTRLDLSPPRVTSIFPSPDNASDGASTIQGASRATGSITINAAPLPKGEREAVQLVTSATFTDSSAYRCAYDGALEYVYREDAASSGAGGSGEALVLNTTFSESYGFVSVASVVNGEATIGCGLTVTTNGLADSNTVNFTVAPAQPADTVTIANARFDFGLHVGQVESGSTDGTLVDASGTPLNAAQIAALLADSITARLSAVDATVSGAEVTLTAAEAGASGNAIMLKTSNPSAITLSGGTLTGGADQELVATVNSRPDEPRNAIIQINFNEAINPLTVSGDAATIANSLQVRCVGGACAEADTFPCGSNQCLNGEFMVSNVYRTVEFRTKTRCGENSCGEDLYCLPGNANVAVRLTAAELQPCAGDATACEGPAGGNGRFEVCQNPDLSSDPTDACFDADDTQKHFPTVTGALDGIVDVALNSLDGNKNLDAQGPGENAFNENDLLGSCSGGGAVCTDATASVCGSGGSAACLAVGGGLVPSFEEEQQSNLDNYQWSFWTSDRIESEGPEITAMDHYNEMGANESSLVDAPGDQVNGIATRGSVRTTFSRLMMSASLKPGYNYPNDFYPGTDPLKNREYLAFVNFGAREVGYWVKKDDWDTSGDSFADQTTAITNHTPLAESEAYGFVAGSGLKDVYQNCYNPAEDTGNVGNSNCQNLGPGQSCCKGEALGDSEAVCYEF